MNINFYVEYFSGQIKRGQIYGYADQKQYGKFSQSSIPFSMMHRQTILLLPEYGPYWAIL